MTKQENFILKSNIIFNNIYNYSKVHYINNKTPVEIICNKHYSFYQLPMNHLKGYGCPTCGLTNNFINKANKVFNNKYNYENINYKDEHTDVKILCLEHGYFSVTPYSHLKGSGCPTCKKLQKNQKLLSNFLEKAKRVHNNKYQYNNIINEYVNNKSIISITCSTHGIFYQQALQHTRGSGCPQCYGNIKLSTTEFIKKAKLVHGNRYIYKNVIYKNALTPVSIKCKLHGYFNQSPASHLNGAGCLKCASIKMHNIQIKDINEFIKDANKVHSGIYDYSRVIYKGNKTKVEIVCNKHGPFWQTPINHISGKNGCPICRSSKGEKYISKFLIKNNIKYIAQKKFENLVDIKQLSFDFYIPNKNLLIEYNGIQHYQAIDHFGGIQQLKIQRHHDWLKRKYARDNNIELLIIKYTDNISYLLYKYLLE